MGVKMIAKNVAEKMRLGIRAHLPHDTMGGLLSTSKKDARVKMERLIESYGGILIYSEQDESADSYDILGVIEYAFYDGSVIRLQGINYDETSRPNGNPSEALRKIGTFALMKSKIKCMNLPTEWSPS